MSYTISYGKGSDAKSISGLDTEAVVAEAHRLQEAGTGKFRITDADGDSHTLHSLELALASVDVRSV